MPYFRIRRWRFRYRLATLLIVITVSGVILRVETDRRRRAWAIDELRKLGGHVSTRQLTPAWARGRSWMPSFVWADDAEILFTLQPDGRLSPSIGGVDEKPDALILLRQVRVLANRAGLSPHQVKVGVIPTSSTPHTLTSRIAADVRDAGFESAWQDQAMADQDL